MGFLSVLKKIGGVFKTTANVIREVQPLMPVVAGLLPTGPGGQVMDIFNGTAAVVGNAEAMFGAAFDGQKTGPAKLAAVIPYVGGLINASQFMMDKKVVDGDLFQQGCTELANAVHKVMSATQNLTPDEVNQRMQDARTAMAKLSGQYVAGNSPLSINNVTGMLRQ